MASLVLGPLLRYVGHDDDDDGDDDGDDDRDDDRDDDGDHDGEGGGGCATVWVEVDGPCVVSVLGATSPAFCVAGHWYALVVVRGLARGSVTAYDVHLDDAQVWPLPGSSWPPSTIRVPEDGEVRLAFGSCRVAGPLDDLSSGVDALHALAEGMRTRPDEPWPHHLLLVGDQVYADENISPDTRAFIESRRDTSVGAGSEVADVEEYTRLYLESWSPEPVRWLLSTVPSAMVFDDHDVRDDWNTSATWRAQMAELDWWPERIEAGLMTYWVYQHLGNMSPSDLARDALLAEVRAQDDGEDVLRAFARRCDDEIDTGGHNHWSFCRDLGATRMVVMDSRAGRVLTPERREMLDDSEWEWLAGQLEGDYDHLLIGTSVPFLLPPGVHGLEAFDEALAEGAWGRLGARAGEALRQAADLEHWAAFGASFARMTELLADVGSRPGAPATITFLSGDVHFAYVARARFPGRPEVTSRVFQAVCSPLRNPLPVGLRYGQRAACSRPVAAFGRWLARAAGVRAPELSWRVTGGPAFGNEVATLVLDGRAARLDVQSADVGPRLRHAFSAVLSS